MASARICKPGQPLSLLATSPLLAVALVGSLAGGPTAHHAAPDYAFIAALHAHGIAHDSPHSAIAAGHLVCHQLDMGKTQEQIATDVMNSSTLDGVNAGNFVAVAERAYWPQDSDIPRS